MAISLPALGRVATSRSEKSTTFGLKPCLRASLATLLTSQALADSPPDYSANLFGDLGGLRTAFAKAGVTLNATESSEVFANPTGGLKQGANYDGATTVTLAIAFLTLLSKAVSASWIPSAAVTSIPAS